MALPSTGSISMNQINIELGRASGSNISLDAAENGSYGAINQTSTVKPSSANPARMSEWRGYKHNCTAVSISPSSVTINQGQSTTLTASGSSSYSWNTGATSAAISVSPGSTTTYTVTGTTTGCNATAASVTVTVIASTTTTTAAPTTTTTTCPPNGTQLSTYCSGGALMGVYADGSCGSYDALIDPCHPDCGCNPVTCYEYFVANNTEGPAEFNYFNCEGTRMTRTLAPGATWADCMQEGTINILQGAVEIQQQGLCGGNN